MLDRSKCRKFFNSVGELRIDLAPEDSIANNARERRFLTK